MSNMSYCRFRNTRRDLDDCLEALYDREELSTEEAREAVHLLNDVLTYCLDYGIIRTYDEDKIDSVIAKLTEDEDEEEGEDE